MELVNFIRFFAEARVSRISLEKNISSGYFEKYPERKEMFEQSDIDTINNFIKKNPEAVCILKSIEKVAIERMKESTEKGDGSAESDKLILDDINYIMDRISVENPDVTIEISDDQYKIIKLISEARCCEMYAGVLEGAKNINLLLKQASQEIIEKALEVAHKVDTCDFPKRHIADSLDLEVFKAGKREPKGSKNSSEGPEL